MKLSKVLAMGTLCFATFCGLLELILLVEYLDSGPYITTKDYASEVAYIAWRGALPAEAELCVLGLAFFGCLGGLAALWQRVTGEKWWRRTVIVAPFFVLNWFYAWTSHISAFTIDVFYHQMPPAVYHFIYSTLYFDGGYIGDLMFLAIALTGCIALFLARLSIASRIRAGIDALFYGAFLLLPLGLEIYLNDGGEFGIYFTSLLSLSPYTSWLTNEVLLLGTAAVCVAYAAFYGGRTLLRRRRLP
jgi:hypothetical protein